MSASSSIPEGVTVVVVARGNRGKHHRPKANAEEPLPACGCRSARAGYKRKKVDVLEPFVDPCAYCFDVDEPRGPDTVTGP